MQSVLQVVAMEEHAMLLSPLLTVTVPVDLQVPTARIQVCWLVTHLSKCL